LKSGNTEREEI